MWAGVVIIFFCVKITHVHFKCLQTFPEGVLKFVRALSILQKQIHKSVSGPVNMILQACDTLILI